jgi:release factor glutamine methyltransferase
MTAASSVAGPSQMADLRPEQTIAEAEAQISAVLRDAGIEDPRRDARHLLGAVLGIDSAALLTNGGVAIGSAAPSVSDAVRRRLAHEPISRIIGRRSFYGRDFIVTPDVLDPRPDTETVVDLALEIVRARGLQNNALRIGDIGTGSGILAATLLLELPRATSVATDISPAALSVAGMNAERLGLSGRVTFSLTNGLEGCDGPLDLIVSNPPYITTADMTGLAPEVRDYDPSIALNGGPDGLDVYRTIAEHVAKLTRPALVVVEVGAGQSSDVIDIFTAAGLTFVDQKVDLGGHIRAVALAHHS